MGAPREHRIGLVGAGRIGRLHARNIAASDRLRLLAVVDADAAAAEACAAEHGCDALPLDELIGRSDLDAVLICTPPGEHAAQIAFAAGAGKHVFCEKPLADDLGAADGALAAVERAGVVLQVGYNRRFDRNFAAVREAVDAGRVGTICLVRISSRDPDPPPPDYIRVSPGLFFDTTSHDLDLARFLVGSDIVEVSARGAARFSDEVRAVGGVDTAATTAVFESGVLAVIDNCWRSAYGYDQRVEVHGTEGTAAARNEVVDTTVVADGDGFHAPVLPHFYLDRYLDAFRSELDAFADALDGGPVAVTGHDGRQALAASIAAQRSHDEGRTVALAEL